MFLASGFGDVLPGLLGKCLGIASALGAIAAFVRLYQMRMITIRVARQGLPMIPHNFFFGHLLTVAKIYMKHREIPPDLHGHWVTFIIRLEYPEIYDTGVIYLDTWPIGFPMIITSDPELVNQVVISPSLPKHYWLREGEFRPFSGAVDMVTTEGPAWKEQRAIYNPGFAARNMAAMTNWFLEEVLVFRNRLLKFAATQETIKLEKITTDLTLDAVMRATFNKRTKNQELSTPGWIECIRKQLDLLYFNFEPMKYWNPLFPLRHWRYNDIIRKAIEPLVLHAKESDSQQAGGPKTIVGLAVSQYQGKGESIPPDVMYKIVNNIKMFVFAGFDTTAVALAAAYYRLSCNPDKHALLRAEHDEVFGPDPSRAADAIRADNAIMNKLPYTLAVIKETLRLHPPVGGSIRQPHSPDFTLVHPKTGMRFPTAGFAIHNNANCMHLDHRFWPRPSEFIPERFLTRDPNDPLYPVKNAWQPFSGGPRACIGQEMVYLELKMALALTVREIEVVHQYPEDAPTYLGEKAYQIMLNNNVAIARAKDSMPVKIKRVT